MKTWLKKGMNNLIGQSLGRYHILEQLGEGGMAVVYLAEAVDEWGDILPVALKFMKPRDGAAGGPDAADLQSAGKLTLGFKEGES